MPDTDTQFWFAASTEEFTPSEMLEQAKAAEAAGFDGTTASDHWAPWFPDGRGSSAWAFLGAPGQHTTGPLGTSVTPLVHHYHPGVAAQMFMGLEDTSTPAASSSAPDRARRSTRSRSALTGRRSPSSRSASSRRSTRSRG